MVNCLLYLFVTELNLGVWVLNSNDLKPCRTAEFGHMEHNLC